MQIKLLDYANTPHYVEIPDNTDHVDIDVISGDMIMTYPINYDTGDGRSLDFYDGSVTIPRDKFDALNSLAANYGIFDITD